MIYLVDVDGSLRGVPDQSTMVNLYGDNGAPVEPHDLSGLTIGPHLTSGAYLATDRVKSYLVEPPTANDHGRKRWITSTPVKDQFAFKGKLQTVDPLVLAAMPCGRPDRQVGADDDDMQRPCPQHHDVRPAQRDGPVLPPRPAVDEPGDAQPGGADHERAPAAQRHWFG